MTIVDVLLASSLILSAVVNVLQRGQHSRDTVRLDRTVNNTQEVLRKYHDLKDENVQLRSLLSPMDSATSQQPSPLPNDWLQSALQRSQDSQASLTTKETSEPSVSHDESVVYWSNYAQGWLATQAQQFHSQESSQWSFTNLHMLSTSLQNASASYWSPTDLNTSPKSCDPHTMPQPPSNPPLL